MKIILIILSVLTLSACGQTNNSDEGKDLLEGQRELMKKAEAVEEDMQKALEERMKEVDQQ